MSAELHAGQVSAAKSVTARRDTYATVDRFYFSFRYHYATCAPCAISHAVSRTAGFAIPIARLAGATVHKKHIIVECTKPRVAPNSEK
jgi:hypothetical protein